MLLKILENDLISVVHVI